ncbi:MAG: hypothetical protein KBC69_01275 [Candidatus Magasanikbacteria bacterium]|nr:hypothetical protein [Candidatus Magasanikbacteria bacterium]
MEDSPSQVANSEVNAQKLDSANSGKLPWQLRFVIILMWFSGVACILRGARMLLVFGLGLIPIIIGLIIIKYARLIAKMEKKAYVGAMVIMGLSFVGALISVLLPGRDGGIYFFLNVVTLAIDAVPLGVLYYYREKFVDKSQY